MPNGRKYGDFTATIFDPEWKDESAASETAELFLRDAVDRLEATYAIAGVETCPDTGRLHLQCFVSPGKRRCLEKFRRDWHNFHIEQRRGSKFANFKYCSKSGKYFELGERPTETARDRRTGKQEILVSIFERLERGESSVAVFKDHPGLILQYGRRYRELLGEYRSIVRSWKSQVVVLWGPTGSGKTRRSYRELSFLCGKSVWWSPDLSLQWFDGYSGHKGALFDDFSPNESEGSESIFRLLLRLLDRYPVRVPVKGGFVEWSPRLIYFTSNTHPNLWFPNISYDAPLLRRIEVIENIQ